MATIPWLVDVLRGAGVQVVVEGDWLNRMRPGSFDPIGVLWHHTAATSSASNPHPALGICINGRSDLAGPLCQALVDYNGVFHVISAGRCNHAGTSGGSGPIPAGDGNTLMIGWEIDYNGVNQEMTAAQYNASIAATAAVLTRLGRDSSYARGHRETSTSGKIDPSFIDLNVMRADVAAKMSGGGNPPAWSSIVDNTTSGRFTASANWGVSTYSGQRYGADYRYAEPVAASDVAWYRFNVPATANYRVDAWWPATSGYNGATPYVVATTTGNRTIIVDQRATGGQWRSLGTFTLPAGDANRVGVSRWSSATGLIVADAVRLTRV
ncbi:MULTISPECIES: N-acetylmuramoyl-L-alanine amidase [Micromonospora]|uniref:golvesin C-terminal-like domain-containing protein n=1 Tax=Micromonospora TaxID=1873 RepID=UPI001B38C9EE|nr:MULTISPECIES: N-acetylmuramoyl-L-alanine amidase [unclassified Micromonospora]MBQ0982319.1 N-acetylmuramoyl-L-alanine amidase [Micromonospora sp. M61]MBQ1039795.1 N-acetylmuramoyl-L-alanine amidase [Micromonospora sp. C81]WTI19310.1 N-acetylmuramoyl-L-alanine amidase [Micromonospora zamorensis]